MALGHRLLIIAQRIFDTGTLHLDMDAAYHDARDRTQGAHRAVQRLTRLGYRVTVEPVADTASGRLRVREPAPRWFGGVAVVPSTDQRTHPRSTPGPWETPSRVSSSCVAPREGVLRGLHGADGRCGRVGPDAGDAAGQPYGGGEARPGHVGRALVTLRGGGRAGSTAAPACVPDGDGVVRPGGGGMRVPIGGACGCTDRRDDRRRRGPRLTH